MEHSTTGLMRFKIPTVALKRHRGLLLNEMQARVSRHADHLKTLQVVISVSLSSVTSGRRGVLSRSRSARIRRALLQGVVELVCPHIRDFRLLPFAAFTCRTIPPEVLNDGKLQVMRQHSRSRSNLFCNNADKAIMRNMF